MTPDAERPVRLLQVVHAYPPSLGGVQLAVRDLCERLLSDYGFRVTVLTTNVHTTLSFRDSSLPTIPIDPDEVQNGVRVRRFPVETKWALALEHLQRIAYHLRLPGNSRLRTLFSGPISPHLLRATCEEPADVICAASFPFNHLRYPFRRPKPRPPIVLVGAIHTENRWSYHRPDLIRLIDDSYAIVVHSEHERGWLVEQGAPPDRIRVIVHGIEIRDRRPERGTFRRRLGIAPDAFVVAYVGQQGPHKGIDTLLRVLPHLREQGKNARLVVAGAQSPYSSVLRALVRELPEDARTHVDLLDDVSDAQKAEILTDCDVFASPSEEESFGITTLEAWAHEKPVVLGSSPGQKSVVDDGALGLLVPHGDERRLLQALVALADDEPLRTRLGRAGHERLLARHDLSQVVAQYHELFTDAARARPTPP